MDDDDAGTDLTDRLGQATGTWEREGCYIMYLGICIGGELFRHPGFR